jgi:hypothetical protein
MYNRLLLAISMLHRLLLQWLLLLVVYKRCLLLLWWVATYHYRCWHCKWLW